MYIKIKAGDQNLSLPVPTAMAPALLRMIPESLFQKWAEKIPAPYDALMTKDVLLPLLLQCLEVFQDHKGLEIVHVEGSAYVSITL